MTPIHELLDRIRWDTDFDTGEFEFGYLDRYEHRTVQVGIEEVSLSTKTWNLW